MAVRRWMLCMLLFVLMGASCAGNSQIHDEHQRILDVEDDYAKRGRYDGRA